MMKCDRNTFCAITFTVGVLIGAVVFSDASLHSLALVLFIGYFFYLVRKIDINFLKKMLLKIAGN